MHTRHHSNAEQTDDENKKINYALRLSGSVRQRTFRFDFISFVHALSHTHTHSCDVDSFANIFRRHRTRNGNNMRDCVHVWTAWWFLPFCHREEEEVNIWLLSTIWILMKWNLWFCFFTFMRMWTRRTYNIDFWWPNEFHLYDFTWYDFDNAQTHTPTHCHSLLPNLTNRT